MCVFSPAAPHCRGRYAELAGCHVLVLMELIVRPHGPARHLQPIPTTNKTPGSLLEVQVQVQCYSKPNTKTDIMLCLETR